MDHEKTILLAKEGHEHAFRSIYEAYRRHVYGLAYRYVKKQADAEDIMQDTFVRAFKHIRRLKYNGEAAFTAWLKRICINCTMTHLRKTKHWKPSHLISLDTLGTDPRSKNPSPEDQTALKHDRMIIHHAFKKLTPKQHVILDMRFFQGFKIREIAGQLGCSESNVKTQIHRSLGRLKKHLICFMGES